MTEAAAAAGQEQGFNKTTINMNLGKIFLLFWNFHFYILFFISVGENWMENARQKGKRSGCGQSSGNPSPRRGMARQRDGRGIEKRNNSEASRVQIRNFQMKTPLYVLWYPSAVLLRPSTWIVLMAFELLWLGSAGVESEGRAGFQNATNSTV